MLNTRTTIGHGLRIAAFVVLGIKVVLEGMQQLERGINSYFEVLSIDFILQVLVPALYSGYFVVAAALYIIAVLLLKTNQPPTVGPVKAKKRDWILAVLSVPPLIVIFHELVICSFFPSLGVHGADAPGCSLGWGIFMFLPFIIVWLLFFLFAGIPRFIEVFNARQTLSRGRQALVWAPALLIVVPLAALLIFLLLAGFWEFLVEL